jgi:putative membrane protein
MGTEPDYRFTFANERTFLAYVRTALGLDAGGLAIKQFVGPTTAHLRLALAVGVVGLALVVVVFGYVRWRRSERAIRLGAPLPALRLPVILAAGMMVASAVAIALITTSH